MHQEKCEIIVFSDGMNTEESVSKSLRDPPQVHFACSSYSGHSVILYASGKKVESFTFEYQKQKPKINGSLLLDFEITGLVKFQSNVVIFGENYCFIRKYLLILIVKFDK